MSYQVLARKWRPQRFADVIGQQAVTRTLQNAITHGRIAQAFVFGGPRGVGKTTTARILARALNCVKGPTPDPCGQCDACREIAEGRDMDVQEIDAATHTGIDNVREVIIAGLSIMPARDRHKIFIIDEVHQLSRESFNALLKSIEEPPPHVVFIMATTVLDKIPDTVLSRSQIFEFKTIAARMIADELRRIAQAEGITIADDSLRLIARAAEGSMRDAQSMFDQVIAFAGETIGSEDVSTVLGLVGRDLLLDAMTAVADENGAAAFELAARAVELGYDLRLVCSELSRLTRDLLILSIDPSRIDDPEIGPEGDRERLKQLAARFSREDLLRGFDVITRAEFEIKNAAQPRYHLEMALLRWMQLRKLVPLEEIIERLESGSTPSSAAPPARSAMSSGSAGAGRAGSSAAAAPRVPVVVGRDANRAAGRSPAPTIAGRDAGRAAPDPAETPQPASSTAGRDAGHAGSDPDAAGLKDLLLAEVRKSKASLFNVVIAQAQKIDAGDDRVTFTFLPAHRMLRDELERNRAWLETTASRLAGRGIAVVVQQASPETAASRREDPAAPTSEPAARPPDLRAEALADPGVQAMLEMFPAEIRDVEELEEP